MAYPRNYISCRNVFFFLQRSNEPEYNIFVRFLNLKIKLNLGYSKGKNFQIFYKFHGCAHTNKTCLILIILYCAHYYVFKIASFCYALTRNPLGTVLRIYQIVVIYYFPRGSSDFHAIFYDSAFEAKI